jgi:hypothetical protein
MKERSCLSIVALISGLLLSSTAYAENWIYVTSDSNKLIYYYDKESLRPVGDKIAVWAMQDAAKDRTVKYRSRKDRLLYDCANETFAVTDSINYDANGSVIESFRWKDHELDFNSIVPGSIGKMQFDAICRNR